MCYLIREKIEAQRGSMSFTNKITGRDNELNSEIMISEYFPLYCAV